ncbi:thioredoxin-like protein [Amylostereum chailletii]|nr:thioredoxin-like protein [Amylostereum chailletii]
MFPLISRSIAPLRALSSFSILYSTEASSSTPSARQLKAMSVKSQVDSAIADNKAVIFSKSYCPYCRRAKALFSSEFPSVPLKVFELDEVEGGDQIQAYLAELTGQRTVPNVFINQKHIGGSDDLAGLHRVGGVRKMLL